MPTAPCGVSGMADPAFATARHVDELTDVALDGLPGTAADRIEADLLSETEGEAPVGAWLDGERPA